VDEKLKYLNECRKIVSDVLDEYQSKGFIERLPGKKKWVGNNIDDICFYAEGKLKWNVKPTNFSFSFYTYHNVPNSTSKSGFHWVFGALEGLIDQYDGKIEYPYIDKVEDLDKWRDFIKNLVQDINEKTALQRLMVKKCIEGA